MGTAVVGSIIFFIVALAIRSILKSHKEGVSCSCGCSGCPKAKKES